MRRSQQPEAEGQKTEAGRRKVRSQSGASLAPVQYRWYLLFLIPCVAMLTPPLYNSIVPTLGGIPFFYWYQLVWLGITAGLTVLVEWLAHRPPSAMPHQTEAPATSTGTAREES